MSDSSLPENWIRCMSKKFKQYYYFNKVTEETSWLHPLLKENGNIIGKLPTKDQKENPKCSKRKQIATDNSKKIGKEKKPTDVKKSSVIEIKSQVLPNEKVKLKTIAKSAKGKAVKDDTNRQIDNAHSTKIKNKIKRCTKPPVTYGLRSSNNNDSSQTHPNKQINNASNTKSGNEATKRKKTAGDNQQSDNVSSDVIGSIIPKPRYQPYKKPKIIIQEKQKTNAKSTHRKSSLSKNEKLNPFLNSNFEISKIKPHTESFPPDTSNTLSFVTPVQGVHSTSFVTKENTGITLFNQAPGTSGDHETEEESMDVDCDIQISQKVIREIKGLREDNTIARPTLPQENTEETHMPVYVDPLYIVLDTNILLAHLKFVQELKDYPIPGIGPPILYIPWMVLQELDSLKDAVKRYHTQVNNNSSETKSFSLSVFARKAIKFISTCLLMDHPRVKGQTVIEAGTAIEGFVEETNDDSIVHAALGLKHRAAHSHIILLSNDRNLCNKSMFSGIKAFSQQNLMMGLRSLFQNGTVALKKENLSEYFEEYRLQELIAKRRHQADELSCELQCILREGLAKVIEDEMKEAYGDDLWLKIVKIQPPWTLHDVFDLLEKHWIAVFGMIVKRQLVTVIGQLKSTFHMCEGSPGSLQKVKELLSLSQSIFEAFSIHSSYDSMITKCLSGVQVLFKKCEESLKQAVPLKQLPSTEKCGSSDQSVESSTTPAGSEQPTNSHEKVMEAFDAIWRTVKHFSALIFYSLNFPSPLINELGEHEVKPQPAEAFECLMTMTKCLLNLIRMIQAVLRIPVERLRDSEQTIVKLLEEIFLFMKEVMKQNCNVQPTELLHFCEDGNTRSALIQGLSQLDRSYAMLQQCIDYHQSLT